MKYLVVGDAAFGKTPFSHQESAKFFHIFKMMSSSKFLHNHNESRWSS
jgi:hypothetical protein